MKIDPRLALYGSIILGGIYVGILDAESIHRQYKLNDDTKLIMYLHGLVISYMIQGSVFYERADVLMHFLSLIIIAVLWLYNRNCILTIFVKNNVRYTDEDYFSVIGKNPQRMHRVFSFIIPLIFIDAMKLLYMD